MPLVTVIALVAGCARNDPAGPVLNHAADLMVLIPAGTFQMGDGGGPPDETTHTVSVNSFYLDNIR